MKNLYLLLSFGLLAFILSSCSSSDTAEEGDELFDDEAASSETSDADFVPQDDMEFFDSGDTLAAEPLPEPAPSMEAAPAPDYNFNAPQMSSTIPVSSGGEGVDYTVQSGDTLMKIAFHHYGDLYRWKDIYHANQDKISNPNQISKGIVLRIEGATHNSAPTSSGEMYAIKSGDTLGTISSRVYGTPKKWKSLWENNKELIKDPNQIYAGFNLYYMSNGESTPDYDSQPLGGTDLNQPISPSFESDSSQAGMSGSDSLETRDPSSVKAETPPPAAAPAANPDQLWNDKEEGGDDAGFSFE